MTMFRWTVWEVLARLRAMRVAHPKPVFRLWIPGRPQSFQKSGKLSNYRDRIRQIAAEAIPRPTTSKRIDIELWFSAAHIDRADVDNILKPVLDALIGVAYGDDRQVRSVRAVAIDPNDVVTLGPGEAGILERLGTGEEFLVNVFAGQAIPGFGP